MSVGGPPDSSEAAKRVAPIGGGITGSAGAEEAWQSIVGDTLGLWRLGNLPASGRGR
jgi:hypothetical protein